MCIAGETFRVCVCASVYCMSVGHVYLGEALLVCCECVHACVGTPINACMSVCV